MKNIIFSLLILIFSGNSVLLIAQCSDAGVCSVGHIMDDNKDNILNINLGYKFGSSGKEDDVMYHSFLLGAVYNVLEKTAFLTELLTSETKAIMITALIASATTTSKRD